MSLAVGDRITVNTSGMPRMLNAVVATLPDRAGFFDWQAPGHLGTRFHVDGEGFDWVSGWFDEAAPEVHALLCHAERRTDVLATIWKATPELRALRAAGKHGQLCIEVLSTAQLSALAVACMNSGFSGYRALYKAVSRVLKQRQQP